MCAKPLRRTQAIAPFGPGAMVDFPGPVSLIHCGIDAWPFREDDPDHQEFKIDDEPRLAERLDVDYFVQPPDFRRPHPRPRHPAAKSRSALALSPLPQVACLSEVWSYVRRCLARRLRAQVRRPYWLGRPAGKVPPPTHDGSSTLHCGMRARPSAGLPLVAMDLSRGDPRL